MENSRFLKHWRSWSGLRKAQILFSMIGALVAITMVILNSFPLNGWDMIQIDILMSLPAKRLVQFLGIQRIEDSWLLLSFLQVALNILIGFTIGTLVGIPWLVCSKYRNLNQENRHK